MKRIYAIYDIIAEMILGDHLQTFRHDAAAIRFFSDVAKQEGTMVRQHTADFRLITIAELHDNAKRSKWFPTSELYWRANSGSRCKRTISPEAKHQTTSLFHSQKPRVKQRRRLIHKRWDKKVLYWTLLKSPFKLRYSTP